MKKVFVALLLLPALLFAQKKSTTEVQPPYTPAEKRLQVLDQWNQLKENSLVSEVEFRNVGPTIMSGRVVDVDVNPDNTTEFYVAYASGGVWYTNNNGMSFTPVFDQEAVLTVGDIAVDWLRKIIWVGTGENNSSRSSYSGVGIYKGKIGGNEWFYSGLGESEHIGRIVLDEDNPNVVLAAALGHLYSQNKERGIFKTSDGGMTWRQTLYINDSTGCIDLIRDPNAKSILYAAAWQRNRRAWNFQESGKGSGIYKSEDGGETWRLVTNRENGFPLGDGVGRIGLTAVNDKDLSENEHFTVLYALLDNQFLREKKEEDTSILTKDMLRTMTSDNFQKMEKKKVEDFLRDNGFPDKYTADTIFTLIKSGKITPLTLVEFLEDAESLLFDTDVKGAELYRSDNGGFSWHKTHEGYLDDMYYTYGYYFGQVRTMKDQPDKVYIMGFVVLKSDDGGKTFQSITQQENVHVDNHALWIDQNKAGHIINGNDGGINISYDEGKTWIKCNNPPVGQFYTVNVDMEEPYNVYGGLQDNGVWYGPSITSNNSEWHQSGQYPYKEIMSGDGMQVGIDSRGSSTIYTGYQFGNYFRVNLLTQNSKYITPIHELGERPYRWNWQSPIQVSVHNQDILYFGAHKLFRSMNRGDDWKPISADLTKGGKKGNVPYGTITTISESPLKFSLVYTGSDDGLIYVTKDGGDEWKKISDALPQNMWVSRVIASKYAEGRVYLSLNGYRWDDFNPYLYVSDDYGATWKKIGLDLPMEPINVVKEDPVNENILYVGTDNGVYVSLDRGKTFMAFTKGLPRVAVHDLVIHPRDQDIVLGTHGRSIYIASVKELQQLRDSILQKPLHVFALDDVTYRSGWGKKDFTWDSIKGPEIKIPVYLSQANNVTVTVYSDSALVMKQLQFDGVKGLNFFTYDLSFDSTQLKLYEDWLNKDLKEGDEKVEVKKADNKVFYLRSETYELTVEVVNSIKSKKQLVLKDR